jgi:hypothetical protein
MSERTFFINGIPTLYERLKKAGKEEEAKKLMKDFLSYSFNTDLDEKVKHFLEIPGGIIPADMEYFKLYWELNQLYINGLFYSAAVLAGVLCERICYDLLSNQKVVVAQKELSKDQITCLFKINLVDMIRLLREWKLIKENTMKEMLLINDKRNQYVHPTKSRPDAQRDSLEMIKGIAKILRTELDVKIV